MMETRMSSLIKLPPFGSFHTALHAAGISTGTARGFWGGVTAEGGIVVTSWTDSNDGNGFYIWRPRTNHGGLKTAWEIGNIRLGTEVTLILLRQRGSAPIGTPRSVAEAALMPQKWRVVKLVSDEGWQAVIEPVGDTT